ncbi:hypothetical protein BHU61_13255 (plasmid) [Macrococcus epidermidis]|uniref:Uncharacterized protein n=1 Tax=Macrococcus epidermidis TaxID=1902580 RepID=A0A327ZLN8_9STAP|nr:hypothetical protein [Macrococcus epidermidis]RAK43559.1 hypothetical protein BHU61_13255 [Macrococcus epidermidis]
MLDRLNGIKTQQDETDQQEIDLTQYIEESEIENFKMSYGAHMIAEKRKEVERLKSEIESIEELNAYDKRVEEARKLIVNVLHLVWNDETQALFDFTNEMTFSISYQALAGLKQKTYVDPSAGFGDVKRPSQTSDKEFGKQLALKTGANERVHGKYVVTKSSK